MMKRQKLFAQTEARRRFEVEGPKNVLSLCKVFPDGFTMRAPMMLMSLSEGV